MRNPCLESFFSMQSDKDSMGFWLQNVTRYPLLPKEVIIKLGTTIQDATTSESKRKRAVNKLVLHNLRLIPRIVRQCTTGKKSFRYGENMTEDLFQVGVFGLKRAAELFDPKLGYQFSTYANMWILQAVQREINKNLSVIRIPESALRDYYKSMDNRTKEEALVHICADQRLRDVHLALTALSADKKMSKDGDGDLDLSGLFTVNSDTLEAVDTFEDIVKLGKLSAMQKKILRLTYIENMTISGASKVIGISRDRGRLVHNKAIQKLKLAMAC